VEAQVEWKRSVKPNLRAELVHDKIRNIEDCC